MKYDVATNFDEQLIKYIEENDTKHEVVSLFGKLKHDCVGGGRPSAILVDVDMDYLENYNKKCKEKGIEFNYLLNPLCLAGKDVNSKEHIKIIGFIKELSARGITAVTVNSPYLCEIIKEQFPDIKVTIGIYANVDSVMKVKRWVDLGADEITLVHDINRNFELLKSILTYLKGTDVSVRLIANNFCLHQCPFEINHGSTVAHASENSQIASCYIDYNMVNCYYRKIKYIGNLMSSDWIRPEDVKVYEKLCEETGNDNLVLKLVERTKTTDFLENVIKAYLDREYNGNLSDLMNWGNKLKSPISPKGFLEEISNGDIDFQEISRYFEFYDVPIPYIDNTKLDGFIDQFVNHYDCTNKICWTGKETDGDDEKKYCHYCYNWAKKVVSYPDEKKTEKWIKNNEKLMRGMVTSKIFKGKK